MKRFLPKLTSFFLAVFLLFTAIGCSGKTILSFNNSFNGGINAAVEPGLTEVCEYDVVFKKNENFSSAVLEDFRCENGSFKTTLKVLSSYPGENLPDTDLYDKNAAVLSNVITFTTRFDITTVYKIDGQEKAFDDYVESVVYFLPSEDSFAPLYSKTLKHTGDPFSETSSYSDYSYSVVYGKSSYVLTTTESKTVKYTPKTVIDNAELLFAIRNFNITDTPTSLPVVSDAYKEATSLSFVADSEETKSYRIDINGEENNYAVKIKNCHFNVYSSKESGEYQYFAVQKSGGEGAYRAFLTYYSQPLTLTLGELVPTNLGTVNFTLSKVTF